MLGAGPEAEEAATAARSAPTDDRVAMLARAARACRACRVRAERQETQADAVAPSAGHDLSLAAAVTAELASATATLPERQREGLVLRELLRLSYDQISQVMDIEPAAVAPLLARARLRLRVQRRGTALPASPECVEGERALRLLACRQDSEPLSGTDDEWLHSHLSTCAACEVKHAAMLEASVCYRAWPQELPRPGVGAEPDQ